MEKSQVYLIHQNGSLTKLEVILRRFGFRVRTFSNVFDLMSAHKKKSTDRDFIFLDRSSGEGLIPLLKTGSAFRSVDTAQTLVLVTEENEATGSEYCPPEFVELPLEIGAIHQFLKDNHLIYGREHLRLDIRLPGVYSHRGVSQVAEILSLGTGGVFIKTGWKNVGRDDLIEICIPLLGMQKELELEGSVVYAVDPSEENNYLQGYGVRFTQLGTEKARIVEDYLRFSLVTECDDGCAGFEAVGSPLPGYAATPFSLSAREGRFCLKS